MYPLWQIQEVVEYLSLNRDKSGEQAVRGDSPPFKSWRSLLDKSQNIFWSSKAGMTELNVQEHVRLPH